ncbi:MAG: AsmA family protein [Bryobacteraceae bacterium]
MSERVRRLWWIAPLVLLAGALAAPFIGADRFAEPIRRDLEKALGRKVQVLGQVRFRVLPRPGFTISDPAEGAGVLVEELPEYGVEPFAYVETLQVTISLPALLTGHIRVSGIRLLNPSVNLTRQADTGWNVQSLLTKAVERRTGESAPLPSIEISGGRLNFKTGETKSVFYLAEPELLVEPDNTDPDRLGIRIEGEPARTDRSARGLGRLSGRGSVKLNRDSGKDAEIALGLSMERVSLSEIAGLFGLRSSGLGGLLATDARLAGPVSNIAITGRLQFDEFERFRWLLPRSLERSVEYRGTLDVRAQQLSLETPPRADSPALVKLRASRLFGQPKWAALVTVRTAPVAAAAALLKEVAPGAAPSAAMEGNVSGAIGFSGGVAQGMARITGATLKPPEFEEPVAASDIAVRIHGNAFEVAPVTVRLGGNQDVRIEAATDPNGFREVRMQTLGVGLARWTSLWRAISSVPLDPLFGRVEEGRWAGTIRYAPGKEGSGAWFGDIRLVETKMAIAGLADPVRIQSAAVRLAGQRIVARPIAGALGKVRFAGSYDYDAARARPHRLDLVLPEVAASELEEILLPALERRLTLLDRALRRQGTAPDWLDSRRLDIALRATAVTFGDLRLGGFESLMSWDGPKLILRDIAAQLEGGKLTGRATITLNRAEPVYEGQFALRGLPWSEGTVTGESEFISRGAGREFLRNAAAKGSFQMRNVMLSGNAVDAANGRFEWSIHGSGPRWSATVAGASISGETYEGQAATGADSHIAVDLQSGGKPLRITGKVNGLRVEFPR